MQNLDYLPFSENNSSDSSISTHKFTGRVSGFVLANPDIKNERDNETLLDHTLFRQYSSQLGRWTSPDRLRGSITNPQSLNRYAYVSNNPLRFTDPLGLAQNACRSVNPSGQCAPFNRNTAPGTCSTGFGGGSAACNWTPDDNSFFAQMQYQMACGADPLSTDCLTYAARPGPNGNVQVFLPGGRISYRDSFDGSSGVLTEFDGEWITLAQFVHNANEYTQLAHNGFLDIRRNYGKSANDIFIENLGNQVDWYSTHPITECELADVSAVTFSAIVVPEAQIPKTVQWAVWGGSLTWGAKQVLTGGCKE